MRIAQIAPLHESVPPRTYGGIERIVHYLNEELVRMGHEVTVYASGDSDTFGRLVPCSERSLRAAGWELRPNPHHFQQVERVLADAGDFDVLHFHLEFEHFPAVRRQPVPHLTTLHNGLEKPGVPELLREYSEMPLVSISDSEREPARFANYVATVYNGIPEGLLRFRPDPGRHLAFLGRFSPEKGACRAIEIARRTGLPIKLAGKVDSAHKDYYEDVIKPLLREPFVDYVGEIGDAEKQDFLGEALAVVFPIEWKEPFGLVLIESMATGTPVVAFGRGAVPEVVDDGITGFVVDDVDEACAAVEKAVDLDRSACRECFETRFTSARMARDYLKAYERVMDRPLARAS